MSGPVPNEKLADRTVVVSVTPERSSSKLAGPIVYGLKLVIPLTTLANDPPLATNGTIIWLGCPPPIASIVIVLPFMEKLPCPPGGGGPSPRNLTGEPEV